MHISTRRRLRRLRQRARLPLWAATILLGAASAAVFADYPGKIPAHTVLGNATGSAAQAIPLVATAPVLITGGAISVSVATASTFGTVKPDGTTCTVTAGVLTCTGSPPVVSSVSNSDGTLTISPTTGAVVASLALGHANTWTGTQSHNDGKFVLNGLTSGTLTQKAAAVAGTGTITWPAGTTDFTATGPGLMQQSALGAALTLLSPGANNNCALSNGTVWTSSACPGAGASSIATVGVAGALTTNTNANTGAGVGALTAVTSGLDNTSFGYQALLANTTGNYNSAFGYQALSTNVSGLYNTAVGFKALAVSTVGYNTAIGYNALQALTSGTPNTALGYGALSTSTTGVNNTALGYGAVALLTTGSGDTGVGDSALAHVTTGINNTGIGFNALYSSTTGGGNTGMGLDALEFNTTGNYNVGIGQTALQANTTGIQNTAIGTNALYDLVITNGTDGNNTAVGFQAGRGIITGKENTIIGANIAGLAAGLSDTILIGTGDGTIRMDFGKTNAGWTVTAPIVRKGYTVATLPAAPGTGAAAYVTDAVACTFLATLTGGGANWCPVGYNGAAWVGE